MVTPPPGRSPPRPDDRPRVLVVDDEAALRALLRRALEREGFAVAEVANATEAIDRFRTFVPSVTVLDIMLPDRSGISLLPELRELDPGAAIIIVTGRGDEESALRAGASSFFRKPFPLLDLVQEVRQLAAWRSRAGSAVVEPAGCLHRFSLSTGDARDPSSIGTLTLPLGNLLGEAELLGVRIGIGEMVTNAVEHGNLGITAAEKEEALADGRFAGLLASRLAIPENAAKRVWIESRLADGEFRVTVRDEGTGFDWWALADAEPGATLAGRGVLLARVHFDEIRWNERGNEVTLVKRIPFAR
jgi:CheY-like chemotaxis protein/anti-sigma regulatory factor (Ser/Thr protein kinase)